MMKSTANATVLVRSPESETAKRVEQDLKAMERTFKKVSKTRESATAFLQRAGIFDATGKPKKRYR